jgi:hypothetical protein
MDVGTPTLPRGMRLPATSPHSNPLANAARLAGRWMLMRRSRPGSFCATAKLSLAAGADIPNVSYEPCVDYPSAPTTAAEVTRAGTIIAPIRIIWAHDACGIR